MNLLLDTHTFLWLDIEPEKLSADVIALIENPGHNLYLSSISVWEIFQKFARGKLPLTRTPTRFIQEGREQYGIETLPFDEKSAFALARLPRLHGDPFDRMLICQALEYNMALLTSDAMIRQYPVKTLW